MWPLSESRMARHLSISSVDVKTTRGAAVEIAIAVVGVALIAAAMAATQAWLDRHFLPSFVVDRGSYVRIEMAVRIVVAAAGVTLAVIARRRSRARDRRGAC